MRRNPAGWFGQLIQRSDDGGKTWEGRWATSSCTTGVPTTHQWYDGTQHPWEFKRVWHLEPSLTDPDTVYAGVEDAACSAPPTAARHGRSLPGCAATARAQLAARRRRDVPAHIILDPSDPRRIYIAISAAGAFRTDDGGKTWKPINRGLKSPVHPRPECRGRPLRSPHRHAPVASECAVHAEALGCHAQRRRRRFVARGQRQSADRLRVPIDVHAHEPETIYVVPIKSDSEHYPPDGKLRVYRSRTGGNEWEPLTKGLPQRDCYVNVLRDAMAVDSLDSCGVYFGTTGGQVYARPTPETTGRPSSAIFRRCCPSRSRRS
jgi:hypothetical protein